MRKWGMQRGREPLVTGEVYHVFNKTVEGGRPFARDRARSLLLQLLYYYRSAHQSTSFSLFRRLPPDVQEERWAAFAEHGSHIVDIYAYCVMSTHYHLLLAQRVDGGISSFMRDVFNAFTKGQNQLLSREGPLFMPRFKAVRICTEEQLMHVSRYIHLNPYSAHVRAVSRGFADVSLVFVQGLL